MALKLPSLVEEIGGIPIFVPQKSASIQLKKEIVAGILAHGFFNTFSFYKPVGVRKKIEFHLLICYI